MATPEPFCFAVRLSPRGRHGQGQVAPTAISSRFPVTSNPLRILQTLDKHLRQAFTLHVYGRSALALGFPDAPAVMHATMDVDAILPARDILTIEASEDFWRAQEL